MRRVFFLNNDTVVFVDTNSPAFFIRQYRLTKRKAGHSFITNPKTF